MPKALKQLLRPVAWFGWIPLIVVVSSVFVVDIFLPTVLPHLGASLEEGLYYVSTVNCLILLPCMFFSYYHVTKIRRRVKAHDFSLCLNCGYPLKGLVTHGHCPECGSSYEADNVRQSWVQWLGPVNCN